MQEVWKKEKYFEDNSQKSLTTKTDDPKINRAELSTGFLSSSSRVRITHMDNIHEDIKVRSNDSDSDSDGSQIDHNVEMGTYLPNTQEIDIPQKAGFSFTTEYNTHR